MPFQTALSSVLRFNLRRRWTFPRLGMLATQTRLSVPGEGTKDGRGNKVVQILNS